MATDFHFPEDVLGLLVDAITSTNRSKADVVGFFRRAGVGAAQVEDIERQLRLDHDSLRKVQMARTVLERINGPGNTNLQRRREVLKRIVEIEDFSGCWPNDRYKAEATVRRLRDLVEHKDSWKRLEQAREHELREARRRTEAQRLENLRARGAERDRLVAQFSELKSMADKHLRGREFESWLCGLLAFEGVLVREPFVVRRPFDGKAMEQVDGMVKIDSHLYAVEAKWWAEELSKTDISPLMVTVFSRDIRGIVVSGSGFKESAFEVIREVLAQRTVVLLHVEELVLALTEQRSIAALVEHRVLMLQSERTSKG